MSLPSPQPPSNKGCNSQLKGGEVTSKKENFELFHIFGQTSSFLKKVWVS